MVKSPLSGFSSLSDFESSLYKRIKPLTEVHNLKIEYHQPIKIRPANTYFTRDRSWRCSFLCGTADQYALIEARLDFNPMWMMQIEMLAAYNPAALHRLIVVCPKDIDVPAPMAKLTVVQPEFLVDRVLANLRIN